MIIKQNILIAFSLLIALSGSIANSQERIPSGSASIHPESNDVGNQKNNSLIYDYSSLKVTELNYHPVDLINGIDTIGGKSFEFIEFKNTGTTTIDLGGLVLDSAIYYEFPAISLLGAQEFYVIATKPNDFFLKYGLIPSGNCTDFFSNSGEYILLNDPAGNEILSFHYADEYPWPASPDGYGFTLTSNEINPTGDPNNSDYWRPSTIVDGSPFANDSPVSVPNEIVHDLNETVSLYPNPSDGTINISFPFIPKNSHITIYTINGKIAYQARIQDNLLSINLINEGIAKGIYVAKIVSEKHIYHKKFIYR